MIMPGVQKPHWRPCFSQKAVCIGWRSSPSARPSMVLIVGAVGLDGEHRAGLDRPAIDVDGAGAALAGVAADVGAGQVEILAQGLDEESSRLDVELVGRPIDDERDVLAHGHEPPAARGGERSRPSVSRWSPPSLTASRCPAWRERALMVAPHGARNQVGSCASGPGRATAAGRRVRGRRCGC